jgi:hypothetical protein
MSNNKPIDGMIYPTLKASVAGTPRDSAIHSMNSNAQLQAQANNALSGGRHRKRKAYGGGDTLTAPQVTLLYPEVSGPGTGINSQIQANAQTSTQGFANAALDKGATTMGGTRRRRRSRKGGNPDWLWGCMSGGKKRTSKVGRKRKSRKSRRSRKY